MVVLAAKANNDPGMILVMRLGVKVHSAKDTAPMMQACTFILESNEGMA